MCGKNGVSIEKKCIYLNQELKTEGVEKKKTLKRGKHPC